MTVALSPQKENFFSNAKQQETTVQIFCDAKFQIIDIFSIEMQLIFN